MKYLVDVNHSKSKKFVKDNPNFINSKDVMDQTAKDKEVMEYARIHKHGIYTQDKRFALDSLIAGFTVWYRDQETGEKYKLKARHLKFTKKEVI